MLFSVTEALHNAESLRLSSEETFCFFELECQSRGRTRDLRLSQQAALTTAPAPLSFRQALPTLC